MKRQSIREQEQISETQKRSQNLNKNKISSDKIVYTDWVNWVIKPDGITVKNLELDLKDGIVLIKLSQRLAGVQAPKYNLTPKSIHQKRENIRIALNLLKGNGFSKHVSGVAEEDFEKDEEGNTESIDAVPVLGFLWQLMMDYQKKNFNESENLDLKGLSKEEKFLLRLQQFINSQYQGSITEVSEQGEKKLERGDDGAFHLQQDKAYVGVDKIKVSGDKELPIVYVRFGENTTEGDKEAAKKLSSLIIKELGDVVESALLEGQESQRFLDFVSGKKGSPSSVVGKHKVTDLGDLELSPINGSISLENGQLVGVSEDTVLLATKTDKEGLFGQGSDLPIKDVFRLREKYHTQHKGGAATLFSFGASPLEFLESFSQDKSPEEKVEKVDETSSPQEAEPVKEEVVEVAEVVEHEKPVEKPSSKRVLLPVKEFKSRDHEAPTVNSGTEGLDHQVIEGARVVKLWYGFTSLSHSEFSFSPESTEWENDSANFTHQSEVVPHYGEGNSTQDIYVDVPPRKNVVYRLRLSPHHGSEYETPVFFVPVN